MSLKRSTSGFTLVESLIAVLFFSTLFVATFYTIQNFYEVQRREMIKNQVAEETQALVNRLAHLIRQNTIDYSEYYSNGREGSITYGNDARAYERQFFHMPTCNQGASNGSLNTVGGVSVACDHNDPNRFNDGFFNTFADNSYLNDDADENALLPIIGSDAHEQYELYLISADGKTKTILRRTGNNVDDDDDGIIDEESFTPWVADHDGAERLNLKQMIAVDSDGDGLLDDFEDDAASGFDATIGNDWQLISPQGIDIVDLVFYVAPLDDPRKAFNENNPDVQQQPHVTIVLTTRPSFIWRQQLSQKRQAPIKELTIQTTVSSRLLNNVRFPRG